MAEDAAGDEKDDAGFSSYRCAKRVSPATCRPRKRHQPKWAGTATERWSLANRRRSRFTDHGLPFCCWLL